MSASQSTKSGGGDLPQTPARPPSSEANTSIIIDLTDGIDDETRVRDKAIRDARRQETRRRNQEQLSRIRASAALKTVQKDTETSQRSEGVAASRDAVIILDADETIVNVPVASTTEADHSVLASTAAISTPESTRTAVPSRAASVVRSTKDLQTLPFPPSRPTTAESTSPIPVQSHKRKRDGSQKSEESPAMRIQTTPNDLTSSAHAHPAFQTERCNSSAPTGAVGKLLQPATSSSDSSDGPIRRGMFAKRRMVVADDDDDEDMRGVITGGKTGHTGVIRPSSLDPPLQTPLKTSPSPRLKRPPSPTPTPTPELKAPISQPASTVSPAANTQSTFEGASIVGPVTSEAIKTAMTDDDAWESCTLDSDLEEADGFEAYDPYSDVGVQLANDMEVEGFPPLRRRRQQVKHDRVRAEDISFNDARASDLAARPYMTVQCRKYLMRDWRRFREHHQGQLVHVDFTSEEIYILRNLRDIHKGDEFSCSGISWYLPGRTQQDVRRLYADNPDLRMPTDDHLIVRMPRSNGDHATAGPRRTVNIDRRLADRALGGRRNYGGDEIQRQLQVHSFQHLWPFRTVNRSSGDLHDICWSATGDQFALGSVASRGAYNRGGNLLLGDVNADLIKVLDGHASRGDSGEIEHATVTGVKFAQDAPLLFSAGWDATVRVWSNEGLEINKFSPKGKIGGTGWINAIGVNRIHGRVVAAAGKTGNTSVLNISEDGLSCVSDTLRPPKEGIQASTVSFGLGPWTDVAFVGYEGRDEHSTTGAFSAFDVRVGKLLRSITPGTGPHGSVFVHDNATYFLAGVNAYDGGRKNPQMAHMRLFDARGYKMLMECDTPGKDINAVSMSPCTTFITASCTDGNTYVYDKRRPDHILHTLKHDEPLTVMNDFEIAEDKDTGVALSIWTSYGDKLFTGGSDGKMKVWDCRLSNPFVEDFAQMSSSIVSAAFSPASDKLIIGESTGNATMFAMHTAGSDLKDFKIQEAEASESDRDAGVRAGRELLNAGKIVLRMSSEGYRCAYSTS